MHRPIRDPIAIIHAICISISIHVRNTMPKHALHAIRAATPTPGAMAMAMAVRNPQPRRVPPDVRVAAVIVHAAGGTGGDPVDVDVGEVVDHAGFAAG